MNFYVRRIPNITPVSTPALASWALRDVVNDTKSRAFCGPTVVASIARQPISVVRNAFRLVRHGRDWVNFRQSPPIMGVSIEELEATLRLFGFGGSWKGPCQAQSLAAWLESRNGDERTNPTIVRVTGHAVAIRGWEFCDTISNGLVIDANEAPGRRRLVRDVFVIDRMFAPAAHIPSKGMDR